MESLRRSLGRRIQQLRKAQGLSQAELGNRAKDGHGKPMDWKYPGGVERGERNVTIDNIVRIISALGVEPYEPFLFSLKESKTSERVDEEMLVNLVRHTDKTVRPLVVGLVQRAQQRKQ
jgi:transcriptional regulator with XRE-family HTH domain